MRLSLIVAMTEDRVIGRDNKLPWHLSEDLIRFKKITMGHPLIMGRKTYDSIGKPLPGRTNIVVTQNAEMFIPGALVVHNFEQALAKAESSEGGKEEVFVIGGSSLFRLALPKADRLYLTLIRTKIPGDTYFPLFALEKEFKIIEETQHESVAGEKINFSFITATRA